MDQNGADRDLAWWAHAVFGGWRDRAGPRYERLATALADAVEQDLVPPGARLPAERVLADALGVSRGTVVACFDRLGEAGVVRRVQGAGTFVAGRPGWTARRSADPGATDLRRRLAAGLDTIDLSRSVPAGVGHLPSIEWRSASVGSIGHGLDPAGVLGARESVAAHLTGIQAVPTSRDQLVIVHGEQAALTLAIRAVLPEGGTVVAGCPHDVELGDALPSGVDLATVAVDSAGIDPQAVERVLRRSGPAAVFVAPAAHRPTGANMALARRTALLDVVHRAGATVVEDLRDVDLVLDEPESAPAPLATHDDRVVAVGSSSSLLWAGFRIAWVRADEPLRSAVMALVARTDRAASVPSQLAVAAVLDAIDQRWLDAHRAALAERREHLMRLLADRLPAFSVARPPAGLSLWIDVPVAKADAFVHVASTYGVEVAAGRRCCTDGRHHGFVRVSFAEPLEALTLGVERLASAWVQHCEDLATTPATV